MCAMVVYCTRSSHHPGIKPSIHQLFFLIFSLHPPTPQVPSVHCSPWCLYFIRYKVLFLLYFLSLHLKKKNSPNILRLFFLHLFQNIFFNFQLQLWSFLKHNRLKFVYRLIYSIFSLWILISLHNRASSLI